MYACVWQGVNVLLSSLFFSFHIIDKGPNGANYRSSPPSTHQQYLDINREKKKKKEIL
jgi:hypothetical protein